MGAEFAKPKDAKLKNAEPKNAEPKNAKPMSGGAPAAKNCDFKQDLYRQEGIGASAGNRSVGAEKAGFNAPEA